MNYITYVNQFWQLRRRCGITSVQADLYYFLLQECNIRNWQNPMELNNGMICSGIGVSEKTLISARNKLVEIGIISVVDGERKKKSPVYTIVEHWKNSSIKDSINSSIKESKNADSLPFNGNNSSIKDSINSSIKVSLYNNTYKQETVDGNKNSYGDGNTPPPPPPGFDGFRDLEQLAEVVVKDERFVMALYQMGVLPPVLPGWLEAFNRFLSFSGTTMKQERDYRQHFPRWLGKIPNYRTMDPKDYSATGVAPAEAKGGRKVIMRFNGGEVEWTEEQHERYKANSAASGYTFLRYE